MAPRLRSAAPYGFRSVVYFGESSCIPLHDPQAEIARLKDLVATYPEPLKDCVIQDSLWNAELSLRFCRRFASSGDVYNSAGCMTRVAQLLVHALFALNEVYFVSDKYRTKLIEPFKLAPRDFAVGSPGCSLILAGDSSELHGSVELLEALWRETVALTDGQYKPHYDFEVEPARWARVGAGILHSARAGIG
jgi:hypothetical protein